MSARRRRYLTDLRGGLVLAFGDLTVLSILAFAAVVLAFGGALEEFWPVFGAKVGLARPMIALFVGGQNAIEAAVSLVAHRLAGLPKWTFYALLVGGGLMLAVASGLFTPAAMLLLGLYSGVMKLVSVVFEGRLQHAIPSERRATIGSVKSFLAQLCITGFYLSFGPLAQATSYRIAFLACGGAGIATGLAYLAWPRRVGAP